MIEEEGFSYEQFTSEFFRFITPAIFSGESSHNKDVKNFAACGVFLTEPVVTEKR